MMNMLVKELDEKNMGQGGINTSRIIQSIQQPNIDLKQSFL